MVITELNFCVQLNTKTQVISETFPVSSLTWYWRNYMLCNKSRHAPIN